MKIIIIENGPAIIQPREGDIIEIEKNNELIHYGQKDKNVVICRCGKSAKQPYCDGTHGRKTEENKITPNKGQ